MLFVFFTEAKEFENFCFRIVVLNQGDFAHPREHLAISGDIFGCHNRGAATGIHI